jgi:hypothetical protein
MHLIDIDDLLDRLVLTDDHPAEIALQGHCFPPGFRRI